MGDKPMMHHHMHVPSPLPSPHDEETHDGQKDVKRMAPIGAIFFWNVGCHRGFTIEPNCCGLDSRAGGALSSGETPPGYFLVIKSGITAEARRSKTGPEGSWFNWEVA